MSRVLKAAYAARNSSISDADGSGINWIVDVGMRVLKIVPVALHDQATLGLIHRDICGLWTDWVL